MKPKVIYNEKRNRFDILFDYDPRLVAAVKELPDRKYHSTKAGKFWSVPASPFHAAELKRSLVGFVMSSKVDELAATWQNRADHKVTVRKVKGLYEFQEKGVAFVHAAGGRALIGDDMGLGKTIQALAYIKLHMQPEERVLVVAPASVIYKWKDEADKWLGQEWISLVAEGTRGPLPNVNVTIMSYQAATRRYLEIVKWAPTLVIFDEVHYLKNKEAQRSKAARLFCSNVPKIIGISGTPFLNRPLELFNILNMIDPAGWSNWFDFAKRYCGASLDRFGHWDFRGASNQDELARRLKPIMIRRLKSEVLAELPDLTRVIMPVVVNLKEYKEIRKEKDLNALEKLTRLRAAAGRAKAPVAVDWALDFLESSDEKLVIYAHHLDVVAELVEGLKKYRPLTITGGDAPADRQRTVKRFQAAGQTNRVVIITSAAGEGIDLFRASNILFVEREWSPLYEEQVEARLHRMGQENAVTAYYLAAADTVDAKMAAMIEDKRDTFHKIVGSDSVETIVKRELLKEVE